ncbi:MAG: ABC transporter ATP-binding protein [Candidatus Sericytochromatia bacterium]|nr:ABC transporter ATP-binding protein [Candidatus Sericytochromatia bacterium]
MTDLILDARGLAKTYPAQIGQPARLALVDLDLELRRGETYGLLGPNGAGKTTSQKLFLGLVRPTRGQLKVFGANPEDPRTRSRIGYLPENPYFYQHLTGEEFLQFCGGLFSLPREVLRERTERLLTQVRMQDARKVPLRKYSKGMLQRVGIAQALINDPDLVLLDEPMSGLDPVGRHEFRELIMDLKRQGKTIFFNSHILSDVAEICDRVGLLVSGRLVAQGRVDELTRGQRDLEAWFMDHVRGTGAPLPTS